MIYYRTQLRGTQTRDQTLVREDRDLLQNTPEGALRDGRMQMILFQFILLKAFFILVFLI